MKGKKNEINIEHVVMANRRMQGNTKIIRKEKQRGKKVVRQLIKTNLSSHKKIFTLLIIEL